MLITLSTRAQVLFNMGEYRNIAYCSVGQNSSFENATIGIARRDYIKLIKKEVIGILDFSVPLTNHYFTRHSLRKGFQFDVYHQANFRLPFMFASSSIVRENHLYKFHDVTTEFSLIPGIYTDKYTLALDIRYELIVFRFKKYKSDYHREIDNNVNNHWEEPMYSIAKVGLMAGLNYKRFVIYLKAGYERNPVLVNKYLPLYALIGGGFKFGTKPMK